MQQELKDIIAISRTLGADTNLTQGGGGNTSVKTDDGEFMYLKASGSALKNMSSRKGWRRLRIAPILATLKNSTAIKKDMVFRERQIAQLLKKACYDNTTANAQPSIEAQMHALLRQYTIHLHPVAASPYVCSRQGKVVIEKLFAREKLPPLWVPCADTGYMTARKIARLLPGYRREHNALPKILFLQKHGIVINTDTASSAIALTRRVIKTCQRHLGPLKVKPISAPTAGDVTAARKAIRQALAPNKTKIPTIKHYFDKDIARLLAQPDIAKWCKIPPLVPHEISYSGGMPLWIDEIDPQHITRKIYQSLKRTGKQPVSFLVKDIGLFVVAPAAKSRTIKDVVTAGLVIRQHLDQLGGPDPMTKRQQLFTNTVYAYSHS
ncbi:MAG: class II aldolase [Sedimentisphaerales bacterium]|nr:class II aldolase [Sedimentisphaerales bacterium]